MRITVKRDCIPTDILSRNGSFDLFAEIAKSLADKIALGGVENIVTLNEMENLVYMFEHLRRNYEVLDSLYKKYQAISDLGAYAKSRVNEILH